MSNSCMFYGEFEKNIKSEEFIELDKRFNLTECNIIHEGFYMNFKFSENKLFPYYGSSQLVSLIPLRSYSIDEFVCFIQNFQVFGKFEIPPSETKWITNIKIVFFTDYVKILRDLENRGILRIYNSENFISDSGLCFEINGEKYEADCLGTNLNKELTNYILKLSQS